MKYAGEMVGGGIRVQKTGRIYRGLPVACIYRRSSAVNKTSQPSLMKKKE